MEIEERGHRVLAILLKEFTIEHTITSLSKEISVSRVGLWKIIKKLKMEELVTIKPIGKGKTSTHVMKLNWDNPILEKTLILILSQEANKQKRWFWEFSQLENQSDFTILYGSILHSPEKANDIDIINVVSKKGAFIKIDKISTEKQASQLKKVHDINFTPKEFKSELKKPNKAFIHAVKTGTVLYGQEKFIKFMKGLLT